MDEYATGFLNIIEEDAAPEVEEQDDEGRREAAETPEPDSAKKRRSLRDGIFRAANLQDRLLEK